MEIKERFNICCYPYQKPFGIWWWVETARDHSMVCMFHRQHLVNEYSTDDWCTGGCGMCSTASRFVYVRLCFGFSSMVSHE